MRRGLVLSLMVVACGLDPGDDGGASPEDNYVGPARQCVADFPPEGDDDFVSDEAPCEHSYGDPENDATALRSCTPLTVDDIAKQCIEEGRSDCDTDAFIGRGAALCVAAEEGLQQGESEPTLVLVDHSVVAPAWRLTTVTHEEGGCRGGDRISIDAITGEAFEHFPWSEGC